MAQAIVKHQVFVSSTYEDLLEERKEVMHALLELDCIPSGMELFPAANEDQWTLIKKVIDDCDYYILILGGRYGSTGPDGVGYTEMEYRYALENKKPILSFLHKDTGKLPSEKTEQTDEGRKKFQAFRELARKKLCKTWSMPSDLGGVVSRGLVNLQKQHPAVGWVRGDCAPNQPTSETFVSLQQDKIQQLEEQLQATRMAPSSLVFLILYDDGSFRVDTGNKTLQQVMQEQDFLAAPGWQRAEIKMVDGAFSQMIQAAMDMAIHIPQHLRTSELHKITRIFMGIPTVKVIRNKTGG